MSTRCARWGDSPTCAHSERAGACSSAQSGTQPSASAVALQEAYGVATGASVGAAPPITSAVASLSVAASASATSALMIAVPAANGEQICGGERAAPSPPLLTSKNRARAAAAAGDGRSGCLCLALRSRHPAACMVANCLSQGGQLSDLGSAVGDLKLAEALRRDEQLPED